MSTALRLLWIYLSLKEISGSVKFLTDDEFNISIDLIKHLAIRECILVGNENNIQKIMIDVKKFSAVKLPATYFYYNELLINYDQSNLKIGLILIDDNLSRIKIISDHFEKLNKSYEFRRFIWLAFIRNMSDTPENLNVPYDCEFIIIQPESGIQHRLTEFYKVKNKSFYAHFGYWSTEFGLQVKGKGFYSRRFHLNGTELTMIIDHNMQCQNYTSICVLQELIETIAYPMNLEVQPYIVTPTPPTTLLQEFNKFGDILDNGQYLRPDYPDRLFPITPIKEHWAIKYPSTELTAHYYVEPFEFRIWISILSFLMFVTILTLLIHIYRRDEDRILIDNIFMGVESLCNQCGNDNMSSSSLRLTSITLRITILAIMAFYGAVLTSFLAIEIPTPPFNNLTGFLKNGEYRLLILRNGPFTSALTASSNPEMKKIFDNYTEPYDTKDLLTVGKKICTEKLALVYYERDILDIDLSCDFYRITESLSESFFSIYLQKNSPFKEVFNLIYLSFYYEGGVKKRIQDLVKADPAKRIKVNEEEISPINLGQMSHVLLIPLIGVLLAVLILIGELASSSPKKSRSRDGHDKIQKFAWID